MMLLFHHNRIIDLAGIPEHGVGRGLSFWGFTAPANPPPALRPEMPFALPSGVRVPPAEPSIISSGLAWGIRIFLPFT